MSRPAATLNEVLAERRQQDLQWGGAKTDDTRSMADWFSNRNKFHWRASIDKRRRESLIKLAALCLAEIEAIDRATIKAQESK